MHARAGKLAEAAVAYRTAIDIWERARGPSHNQLAQPMLGLAEVHLASQDARAALTLAQRAVAIHESAPGDPANFAHALFVHGQAVFAVTGDHRRTCERMAKALAT